MDSIIQTAMERLKDVRETPLHLHPATASVRAVSRDLFKALPDHHINRVLAVCTELLETRSWPLGVIAFDFAYRVRDQYHAGCFPVFENWLANHVNGWGRCDDLCTHAFGALIMKYPELSASTLNWTARRDFWMRRAAAVVLIPSVRKGHRRETDPFRVADLLLKDEHDLVLKGYGWMLKELSVKEPEHVYDYLFKHVSDMPRVAFRYALEKFPSEVKQELMAYH